MLTQFGRRTLSHSFAAAAMVSMFVPAIYAQPTTPRTAQATPGAASTPPANAGSVANPLSVPSGTPAPAGGAPGAADSTTAAGGKQQTPTEWLIGGAVGDPNSPQYKDVTEAIDKFAKGGLSEARDQLTQARKN